MTQATSHRKATIRSRWTGLKGALTAVAFVVTTAAQPGIVRAQDGVPVGDPPPTRPLVVGGDHDYPPYEFLDKQGHPTGYNVELTRAIAQAVGLDVTIRLSPWAQIRQELDDGRVDVVAGMFFSTNRDAVLDFTPAHAVIHHVSVVRQGGGSPPATVAALRNLRLVAMQGDIMDDFVREQGLAARLTLVASQEEALRELAAGQHDCALVARIPALYWISQHGWTNLVVARRPLLSPDYCYAMPHRNDALLAQFIEGLQIVRANGDYRRIQEKWLGTFERDTLPRQLILRYAALIVIPLLLLLGATLAISASLRRSVAHRTAALTASEAKIAHLNAVLRSIRAVTQLIVRGQERDDLLQQVCTTLVETRTFHSVWIVCFDEQGRVSGLAEAGLRTPAAARFRAQLRNGEPPPCCLSAMESAGPIVLAHPATDCLECSLAGIYREASGIAVRLCHAGRVFGVLGASIPNPRAADAEETQLFHELAGDLAFALNAFELLERHRAAEAQVAQLARFPSENPNPVLRLRQDGVILYANPRADELLQAWGVAAGDTAPESLCRQVRDRLVAATPERIEIEAADRLFLIELAPVANAGYVNLYGKDITDRKRAEAEREAGYQALAQKTEEMESLLYAASHDLRSPLVNIQGFGQRLAKAVTELSRLIATPLDAEALRTAMRPIIDTSMPVALRHVVASTGTMDRLISGLLRLSRLTRNDLQPELLDMENLVRTTVAAREHQIRETGAELTLDPLPACRGEAGQISQVIANLLDNALKYREPTRPLSLRIGGTARDAEVVYEVTDNGQGIKPEYQERIWNVFVRLDPLQSSGEGLGLTVVRRIVQRHGGRVWVESVPGVGSRFFFSLPAAASN